MKKKISILYTAAVLLLILGGLVWVVARFHHSGSVEYTDAAYVRQHITPVRARVQGFIREVRFSEFQPVRRGDTLLIIEDAEYQLRVAEAEAALATAQATAQASEATVSTMQSRVGASDAALAEARAVLDNARREDERFAALLEKNAVTPQQYDGVHTALAAAEARYRQLQQARQSAASAASETSHRRAQTQAAARVAQAQVQLARLNLSYTVVTAPCDGYAGRKDVNPGELVQPGQTLLDIVDSADVWVVANFRETQLRHIAPGAQVSMTVDAIPGRELRGTVESISDATGSAASLIPADPAAGNFVKVEQRVPVRIAIDPSTPPEILARLRAGMSVECEVRRN